jgi:hypothetical protein
MAFNLRRYLHKVAWQKDWKRLIEKFGTNYANSNFSLAADAAGEALVLFPAATYRHFICNQSAAWGRVLAAAGRIDTTVSILDDLFDKTPALNLVCLDDPKEVDRLVEMREQRIKSGLPSPLLVTQGKSGSITLGSVFTSGFELPSFAYSLMALRVIPKWARDYARGGSCYITHLDAFAQNIADLKAAGINKVIVHVRDPRQTLISHIHHKLRYVTENPNRVNELLAGATFPQKVDRFIKNSGDYYRSIAWIEGWVDASSQLDIHFSTFEQFRENPEGVIKGYLDFYGGDPKYFKREHVFTEQEGTDYHFRLGEIDEWRKVMTDSQIEQVNGALSPRLRNKFNWK